MFASRPFGARDARKPRTPARRRPSVELLEGRQLLSTFTVTNDNDSGPGSFRQALISSNATSGTTTNTIKFQVGTGVQTIDLLSALPTVAHAVTIDGSTQPGTGAAPRVVLDGAGAGANDVRGLVFANSNSTLKDVAVVGFSGDGVNIPGFNGITLADDYIGVTPSGQALGNGADGVNINSGAEGNKLTGCVISGNAGDGIQILSGADHNSVTGSLIGLDPSGNAAMPNGTGIKVEYGADGNTIGGTAAGAGNVIAGNRGSGVELNSGAANNVVEGNLIGLNALGVAAVPNGDSGVYVENGSDNNVIGGTTSGARNVISGNGTEGVTITTGSESNTVSGNYIGTNAAGNAAVGNADSGVLLSDGADGNTIGGTAPGAGNVLSGNGARGVHITSGSDGNTVAGNLIGVNALDDAPLGNGVSNLACSGVLIDNGADGNLIGGTTTAASNVIAANGYCGVHIASGSDGNTVEGNWIGTNPAGQTGLGNDLDGVLIDGGSASNDIGGMAPGAGNEINNNGDAGVVLIDAYAGNAVEGNTIDGNGFNQPTAGRGDGIFIMCSSGTTITNNTIDANRDWGVFIDDSASVVVSSNSFQGNGLGNTRHS